MDVPHTHRSRRLCGSCFLLFAMSGFSPCLGQGRTDNSPDWFFPDWAASATYNAPLRVLDTESALGRYATQTKEVGLKDLSRTHGHLCDGLVIAFIEIKAALEQLFPDGVVDRTDLRAVSRNGPCSVDAVAILTGARINFQTLRIDNSIGEGFILQRISTGEAYQVRLKPDVFPPEQAELESRMRQRRAAGLLVSARDIDRVEMLANELSRRLLNSLPEDILRVERLEAYAFRFNDAYGERGDIDNKSMPRD